MLPGRPEAFRGSSGKFVPGWGTDWHNNYKGSTREQHARNTGAIPSQHASSKLGAGCGCRGGTEGIRRAGGVEKLDQAGGGGGIRWGWAGRDRKKEAEVKLPAKGFDWVPDSIPDSNLSDEPKNRSAASGHRDSGELAVLRR